MKLKNTQAAPSLKNNFVYNFLYQALTLFLPFITLPYISRVFGSENVGIYTYTRAFAEYFFLCGMLGITNHGNRSIASVRKNREELSRTFWELFILRSITSLAVAGAYLIYCTFFIREYRLIYFLQIFYVITPVFNVNWFCMGMENFKLASIRNIVVHLLCTIAVFVFVKTGADLWKYTLILSLMPLISVLSVWPYVFRSVERVRITRAGVLKHIRPILILFIPIVAESIFNIMDKLMLGSIFTKQEVGFYEFACRIVIVPSVILSSFNAVMMPRMSHLLATDKKENAGILMNEAVLLTSVLGCSMACGLAAIGKDFAIMFYGAEFARSGLFIMMLSPVIIFKCIADVVRMQYIIPSHHDNIYVVSIITGAIINLTLNIILIPRIQGVGAIIGTLAAEFSVMTIQLYLCRKDIEYKRYVLDTVVFSSFGLVMFAAVYGLSAINISPLPGLLLRVAAGIIVFGIPAFIYMQRKYPDSLICKELIRRLPFLSSQNPR